MKEREYWQLSDEELNRKVEEFITRFNRDMIQQEAAAV
jgi:Txe/YoeB family toxin of Txe-Axe toxin-antitoxin module